MKALTGLLDWKSQGHGALSEWRNRLYQDGTQGQSVGSSQPQAHSISSHATGLSIKRCDFKITMNNNNHHTEEISTKRLMVRRGQPFIITVGFSFPVYNYLQQLKRTFLIVQTGNMTTILFGALVQQPPEEQSQKASP